MPGDGKKGCGWRWAELRAASSRGVWKIITRYNKINLDICHHKSCSVLWTMDRDEKNFMTPGPRYGASRCKYLQFYSARPQLLVPRHWGWWKPTLVFCLVLIIAKDNGQIRWIYEHIHMGWMGLPLNKSHLVTYPFFIIRQWKGVPPTAKCLKLLWKHAKNVFQSMFVPLGTVLQGNESNPRYYSDSGPGLCPVELQTKVPKDCVKLYNHGEGSY